MEGRTVKGISMNIKSTTHFPFNYAIILQSSLLLEFLSNKFKILLRKNNYNEFWKNEIKNDKRKRE
jgi:hypothetical protein